jgi:negative regulator of flagellin synthesis FlgM
MTRIDGVNPLATSRTQHGQAAGGVESSGARSREGADRVAGPQDEISLSNRGRIVADAVRAVAGAPDVRAERVAQIRAAIADGTYRSNARDIAARLFASGTFGGE